MRERFRRYGGRTVCGLFAALILAVAGCGGPKTYPVTGMVRYADGSPITPLVRGCVEFAFLEGQADVRKGTNARGDIQPDGSFSLTTYGLGEGAVEGRHQAIVVPPAPENSEDPGPSPLHPRFQRYETSKLEFTVTRDKDKNHFVIEVTAPDKE